MMPSARILALAICSSMLLQASPAADCNPHTSNPEVDVNVPDEGRYYVDIDCTEIGCPSAMSIWVYEETNDRDGLQQNDPSSGDQTCGLFPADTLFID